MSLERTLPVEQSSARATSMRRTWPLSLLLGGAMLAAWLIVSLLVPTLSGRSAVESTFGTKLLAPSSAYPFGTDALGRDVLVRTAVAFRYDLAIAVGSVALAALLGMVVGAAAGAAPEWLDNMLMGALDVLSAFPSLFLALMMTVALGPAVSTLIAAVAVVLLPQYARGTRAALLAERAKPYAEVARAMAIPPWRIVLVHLLPNSLGQTLTQATMDTASAIMVGAGLSFIGFGVQPPTPEWGLMINEGSSYIVNGQWWMTFFPGLAILSVVTAFLLIDNGVKRLARGH